MPPPLPTWRRACTAVVLTASLAAMAACAPDPVHPVDAPGGATTSTGAVTEDVVDLLTEVARAFGTDAAATQIVSGGAAPAIAATELAEALDLGEQPTAVAAALAHAWSAQEEARQVQVEVRSAEIVGAYQGDPVARVRVDTEVNRPDSPTRVTSADYLAVWDGGTLTMLAPWQEEDGRAVVDSGAGLSSPTGAVRRFLQLLEEERWAALADLSGGSSTDRTELEVLRSVVADADRVDLVQVVLPPSPEAAEEPDAQVVYAVTSTRQVVGRFVVRVEEREVVYERTD
ncbi:hypothetical protein LQF12_12630 [Ruania suaedae]|uniref:hypothetical protein n=1 Tax=Ruania suaedae TaxID=2897774 RepID=UPI001E4EFA5A|nr:hypothetical protein [Ruania suaedae]UFU02339.1 hypothetical protein LQF12_12630 [Ruania suaedae]